MFPRIIQVRVWNGQIYKWTANVRRDYPYYKNGVNGDWSMSSIFSLMVF